MFPLNQLSEYSFAALILTPLLLMINGRIQNAINSLINFAWNCLTFSVILNKNDPIYTPFIDMIVPTMNEISTIGGIEEHPLIQTGRQYFRILKFSISSFESKWWQKSAIIIPTFFTINSNITYTGKTIDISTTQTSSGGVQQQQNAPPFLTPPSSNGGTFIISVPFFYRSKLLEWCIYHKNKTPHLGNSSGSYYEHIYNLNGLPSWTKNTFKSIIRPENMLYYEPQIISDITSSITQWESRSEKLLNNGITSKFVLMLHGPPGSGKSTLARYIALKLGYNVFDIPNSGFIVNGIYQNQLPSSASGKKIALIIDEFENKFPNSLIKLPEKPSSNTPLHTILDFLDGNRTSPGTLIIITLNDPSLMQSKLRRMGRINKTCLIDYPSTNSISLYLQRALSTTKDDDSWYTSTAEKIKSALPTITIADLDDYFKDDITVFNITHFIATIEGS